MNYLTKVIRKYQGTENISLIYHLFANIYLIKSDIGLILIDTGLRGNTWKILRAIRQLGYRPEHLRMIVLSHAHLDHFGCAAALKDRTGAQVAGHRADIKYFENGGVGALPGFIAGRLDASLFFHRMFLGAPAVKIDRPLQEGDQIGEWVVIHSPGHTPGTISLYSKKRRVLITGGWAIPGKTHQDSGRYKNPFVGYISSNPDQITDSRARLGSLDFDTLLCSHFPPRLFPLFARQLRSMKQSYT
jgi:glyoxylase-like metal-dependent hydrolase (beta-lactamase superfamily II)